MHPFESLHPYHLEKLAQALEQGRLSLPITPTGLQNFLGQGDFQILAASLNECLGLHPDRILGAALSHGIRCGQKNRGNLPKLIWSGPDDSETYTESTRLAFRELLESAQNEILIVDYAFFDGKTLLAPLLRQTEAFPNLKMTVIMNLHRSISDTDSEAQFLSKARSQFLKYNWPLASSPAMFYDPRALKVKSAEKAVMHAKCLLVDRKKGLIGSANLTPAAQTRNIEAGVLIQDEAVIGRLWENFLALVRNGHLQAL